MVVYDSLIGHSDLCIRVIDQSPEIFCSLLVGGRDPVDGRIRNGPNRVWCNVLGNVAKKVTLIHLRRNILDIYLESMTRYSRRHSVVLVPGYLGHVVHPGKYMQGSIARVSFIIRRPGSRQMEVTDNEWLEMIVYIALIGLVDAIRSIWPCNPDWRRYIFTMAYRLAMGKSGWNLKKGYALMNGHLRRMSRC